MIHTLFKTTVFTFLLINVHSYATTCRIPTRNLAFFTQSKNVYLVKIIDSWVSNGESVYKVSALKSFNGAVKQEFLVGDFFRQRFKKDSLYLIQPTFDNKGHVRLDRCSYVLSNYDEEFKRDSICFSSLACTNCFVDNEYFKGQLVNGKPHGMWRDDQNYGLYKHGKKNGKWMEFGSTVIYKNDRKVYSEEILHPDTLVIHQENRLTMYYKKETLRVWKQRGFLGDKISKYDKGILQQSIRYYRDGMVKEVICYTNGKRTYSKRYEWDPYKEQKDLIVNDIFYLFAFEYFYYSLNFKCP